MTKRYNFRHLAFTGSKDEVTQKQRVRLRRELEAARDEGFLWMHNGDCVEGDRIAAELWADLNRKIMLHPPIKDKYRAFIDYADVACEPRGYLERDQDMVECSERLYACPRTYDEQRRSGTWTTIRYARKLRMKIVIIFPDGTIRVE